MHVVISYNSITSKDNNTNYNKIRHAVYEFDLRQFKDSPKMRTINSVIGSISIAIVISSYECYDNYEFNFVTVIMVTITMSIAAG